MEIPCGDRDALLRERSPTRAVNRPYRKPAVVLIASPGEMLDQSRVVSVELVRILGNVQDSQVEGRTLSRGCLATQIRAVTSLSWPSQGDSSGSRGATMMRSAPLVAPSVSSTSSLASSGVDHRMTAPVRAAIAVAIVYARISPFEVRQAARIDCIDSLDEFV
jgi:hypothetical protein